nr:MAG TPA: hypothetical protein [Bacteriophage sp.]
MASTFYNPCRLLLYQVPCSFEQLYKTTPTKILQYPKKIIFKNLFKRSQTRINTCFFDYLFLIKNASK